MSHPPGVHPVERTDHPTRRFVVAAGARITDRVARTGFLTAGLSVFAVLGFILWVLLSNTARFFGHPDITLWEYLTGTVWNNAGKLAAAAEWGVLPLVTGTLMVAIGAAVIGVPLGLATAIYLAEYASPRVRATLKPMLEILAGIPSIVFGFFALVIISPIIHDLTAPGSLLHALFGDQAGKFSGLNAIIVVGVMVLPIISSLSEDALRAVPNHLREASLGLGATKWETTSKVVLPSALSGITASFVLGVARAIGETMAVTLAAGASTNARLTFNPVDAILTMTSFIANRMAGDAPHEGPEFHALFAVGFTLFALTLVLNLVAQRFVKRFREVEQ